MFFLLNVCLLAAGFTSLIRGSSYPPSVLPPQASPQERPFCTVKFIEKGAFGQVFLVEDNATFEYYALKKVPICYLSFLNGENDMLWEIATHQSVPVHPNIVGFKKWYRDEIFYHIFTEFCFGGDLLTKLVQTEDGLAESEAKGYAWDIANGLAHLHNAGIIYRDLKSENIFIDAHGTAKIGDFGFARKMEQGQVFFEPVGTEAFRAPEMSSERLAYSFPADVWAYGALVFHSLYMQYPKIVEGRVVFPFEKDVSAPAKDFIISLLVADPSKRPSVTNVLQHPWFNEFRDDEEFELPLTPNEENDDYLGPCCTIS